MLETIQMRLSKEIDEAHLLGMFIRSFVGAAWRKCGNVDLYTQRLKFGGKI